MIRSENTGIERLQVIVNFFRFDMSVDKNHLYC